MENIFVPSKKRAGSAQFLNYADENNLKINVVIEPQEELLYKHLYKHFNFIILPKNDGGITYVRNFIKEFTTNKGINYYWQLDDDITGLFYREGTKLIRSDLNTLHKAEIIFIENGIALGSLEYRQFAWSATKDIIENSFCDTCVFMDNIKNKDLIYREFVEGKEDRDFAMQVIKNGNKTGRVTTFAFSAPANGSNIGGLKEIFYDKGKEITCVKNMIELWGENICKPIVKENGRNDVKIMWNEINNNQQKLF